MKRGKAFRNKQVAVFCGSASGRRYQYQSDAFSVGRSVAKAGHGLVYGGGHVGLMGAVADGCLQAGGQVIGVMPRALVDREIAHTGLTELILAGKHARTQSQDGRAGRCVCCFAGGGGTMKEFFEQWTCTQIGYHQKPIGLLNLNGYLDPLLTMFDEMVRFGFLSQAHREMLFHAPRINDLLAGFSTYLHPPSKAYDCGK